LVYTGSGSGDKTFDWVLAFCVLVVAVLATAVWSVLDRKRESYAAMYKWFRLFLRFALASEMILYGMVKAFPLQMPFPFFAQLIEPFGNFSPMGLLWSSIGASPSYETCVGCAELLGGILLLTPRTTMLGALICLTDMTQVFIINMTYDIPVKLFAFHLILMALFLLAPELRRLLSFFVLNRTAEPSRQPQLFRTSRANRIALAVQMLFGIYLLGMNAYGGWTAWNTYGGGRHKPQLYGIWNVDQVFVNGQIQAPVRADSESWRRAIFDFPDSMEVQHPDDSITYYGAAINAGAKSLILTKRNDKKWKAAFAFQRTSANQLTLDGAMDGRRVSIQLSLVDPKKFQLIGRGFHWIQEYPYNR
jgi:uncharacterized membrane protein YphA (DoxX/SURF4 family)